jgi:hypothetical protein
MRRALQWLPEPEAEPLVLPDVKRLDEEWLSVRQEVNLAMDRGVIPGSGFVYDPRLDTLMDRIREKWATLGEPAVLEELLGLVRKMHDHISAAIFGYAFLRRALRVRGTPGVSYQVELVADFEVAYLNAAGIEPLRESPDVVNAQAEGLAEGGVP